MYEFVYLLLLMWALQGWARDAFHRFRPPLRATPDAEEKLRRLGELCDTPDRISVEGDYEEGDGIDCALGAHMREDLDTVASCLWQPGRSADS